MNLFFKYDSPIMMFLNRFSSLVVLNLLFLCTSIPIFTLGASLSALYDVVFRLDTDRESKIAVSYFRAFRANFRQSVPLGLLFLFLIGTSCANAGIFSGKEGIMGYALSVFSIVLLVNSLLVMGYVFPLISQFDNTGYNTLKNSLLLAIGNLPRTLLMGIVNCFPWMLMLVNFYAFIQLSFLWLVLYFAAAAYFNSRVLMKVFEPLKKQDA